MRHRRTKSNRKLDTDEDIPSSDFPPTGTDEALQQPLPTGPEKWSSFKVRLFWTLVLIFTFFLIVAAGHVYCALLVVAIASLSYKEIVDLKRKSQIEEKLSVSLFSTQRWYWYGVTLFACMYNYVIPTAEMLGGEPTRGTRWIVRNHTMVTYIATLLGVISFVLSLRRCSLRYQFSQLALLVLTCLVVVGQGTAHIRNISSGLVWFFVSTTAVIANDISAYLLGVAFGKTKLLPRISPKKTVEGFLGASLITFAWSVLLMEFLSHFKVMVCPVNHPSVKPYSMWFDLDCEPPAEFRLEYAALPSWSPIAYLPYRTSWIHASVLAAFASFVAPFGGFLASAFKRASKVKDFGAYIPGHGGVTDRFDCQLLMGMFTWLYIETFVRGSKRESMIGKIADLDVADQIAAAQALLKILRDRLPREDFSKVLLQEG